MRQWFKSHQHNLIEDAKMWRNFWSEHDQRVHWHTFVDLRLQRLGHLDSLGDVDVHIVVSKGGESSQLPAAAAAAASIDSTA